MTSYPAWSIGTSQRTFNLKTEASEVPGPGSYAYDSFRKTNPPTWRIGTSRRSSEGRENVPGPGAYDSPGKISRKAPKYHMGMRTTTTVGSPERSQTPGPGAYDYKLVRSGDLRAPSYSIRTKSMTFDGEGRSDSPGPAAYTQSYKLLSSRAPICKIGSSKRDELKNNEDTPGPGTYQITADDLRASQNGPAWGFGSSERANTCSDLKTAPGPGAYELKSTIDTSKARGAVMVSRRPDTSQGLSAYIPGPGAYDQSVKNVKLRAPSVKIGRATRDPLSKELCSVPGPGAYQPLPVRRSTSVRMGTSTRNPLSETMANPGPGTYKYDDLNHGPKHVIVPKRQDVSQSQKDRNTPGPGAYVPNFNMVRLSTPLLRIGTARRDERNDTAESPGPAVYDVRKRLGGPKWGFGTEKRGRLAKKDADPGPGAYEIPSKVANIPKYAMTSSLKSSRY